MECSINVKIKDYSHCKDISKYKICSLLPIDNNMQRVVVYNSKESPELDMHKENAACNVGSNF